MIEYTKKNGTLDVQWKLLIIKSPFTDSVANNITTSNGLKSYIIFNQSQSGNILLSSNWGDHLFIMIFWDLTLTNELMSHMSTNSCKIIGDFISRKTTPITENVRFNQQS